MPKSQRATLAILALMALAGGFLTYAPSHSRAADAPITARKLTVSEEQPVTAPAKGATLYLGLQTTAKDSRSAQSDAADALKRLKQGLRSAGVPASEVTVRRYQISSSGQNPEHGTVVSQMVVVSVPNAELLAQAIDAAVASGATTVQASTDQTEAPSADQRAAAVAAAIRAARGDAQAIAGALGETLGRPTSVEVRMRHSAKRGQPYIMAVRVTFSR